MFQSIIDVLSVANNVMNVITMIKLVAWFISGDYRYIKWRKPTIKDVVKISFEAMTEYYL